MLNLLQVSVLLFQFSTPNNNFKFVYKISNSDKYTGFCTINTDNNGINEDPNVLKIGEFYENNDYVEYYSVLRFTLPQFDSQSISSANITFNKSSGYLSSFAVSYAIGSVSFSNTNWTYLSTASLTGNSYIFSVKNPIQSALQLSCNTIYLKLSSPGGPLNLIGDSTSSMPSLTLYTTESPSTNTYGCASPYVEVSDLISYPDLFPGHNCKPFDCFGYAINIWDDVSVCSYVNNINNNVTTNQGVEQYILPTIVNIVKNLYDINIRHIPYIDSPIYSFERRIAYRYGFTIRDSHFMRETSNGQWAEKNGN